MRDEVITLLTTISVHFMSADTFILGLLENVLDSDIFGTIFVSGGRMLK